MVQHVLPLPVSPVPSAPPVGDIATVRAMRALKKRLGLSAEEVATIELETHDDGALTWDTTKDPGKDFVFSSDEV